MFFYVVSPAEALYDERLAVALGFITLLAGIGVFLSCRCCVSLLSHLGIKNPLDNRFFKLLYGWHAYFWWLFGMALVLHFATAFFHTGLPQKGDPDAGVHWWILGFGFASLLFVPLVLLSCRSIAAAIEFFSAKKPLSSRLYRSIYRFHAYYWLVLVIIVAAHITIAAVHAGFWPHAG